jgi:AraC-like DNA-binding protein
VEGLRDTANRFERMSLGDFNVARPALRRILDGGDFDVINFQRVEEAKRLITIDDNLTLLEIAFKAGFNNKTSFTNAFKKFAGQTPLEFKKNHAKAKK